MGTNCCKCQQCLAKTSVGAEPFINKLRLLFAQVPTSARIEFERKHLNEERNPGILEIQKLR